MSPRRRECGVTLVELMLAMMIGSLLLAALTSVVMLGLNSRSAGRATNEQVYLAAFALERVTSRARATAPKKLDGSPSNSTGTWLAPVMFCRQTDVQRLVETVATDDTCSGGVVLAERVSAFAVNVAPSTRPVDPPVLTVSLTVESAANAPPITVTSTVRMGGGTL